MVTPRRGLLLAGAASLAAAGCGRTATEDEPGGAPRERSATSREGDVELLRAALALEAEGGAALDAHRKAARGRARGVLAGFVAHEDEHLRRLGEAVQQMGGDPEVGWAGYPVDGGDPVDGAIALKNRLIAFYLDMLPKLHDGELRSTVAAILTVESEQLAALRDLAGERPAPDAFVYGSAS